METYGRINDDGSALYVEGKVVDIISPELAKAWFDDAEYLVPALRDPAVARAYDFVVRELKWKEAKAKSRFHVSVEGQQKVHKGADFAALDPADRTVVMLGMVAGPWMRHLGSFPMGPTTVQDTIDEINRVRKKMRTEEAKTQEGRDG